MNIQGLFPWGLTGLILSPYILANQEKVKHCHALESNIFLSQSCAITFLKNLQGLLLAPRFNYKIPEHSMLTLKSCWLPPYPAMAPTKSLYKCFTNALESSTYSLCYRHEVCHIPGLFPALFSKLGTPFHSFSLILLSSKHQPFCQLSLNHLGRLNHWFWHKAVK